LVNPDGTFKATADLAPLFAVAGIDPAAPITATCGSGITAAGIALAAARLGNGGVAVYDGSWADWGARPESTLHS
jgi:thiosulfate/3-mercaptopyruvate sulfurtransferase